MTLTLTDQQLTAFDVALCILGALAPIGGVTAVRWIRLAAGDARSRALNRKRRHGSAKPDGAAAVTKSARTDVPLRLDNGPRDWEPTL